MDYARSRHVTASIAVINTRTGQTRTAGSTTRRYPAASVAKVFSAVALLATGQMHGWKKQAAYRMITRSDNTAWTKLQPYVGRTRVYDMMVHRYHINLGRRSPTTAPGSTQITSLALARFYARVKQDKKVWPWLHRTMQHAKYRADGRVPQFFGIPVAHPVGGFAIKQGWLQNASGGQNYGNQHSTGYIDHGRYAVVMLQRAPARYYSDTPMTSHLGRTISREAQLLMPHGRL